MAAAVSTIIFSPLSASPNSGAAVTDTHTSVRVTAAVAPESLSATPGAERPTSLVNTAPGNGMAHRSVRGTQTAMNRFAGRETLGRRTAMRTPEVALGSGGKADFSPGSDAAVSERDQTSAKALSAASASSSDSTWRLTSGPYFSRASSVVRQRSMTPSASRTRTLNVSGASTFDLLVVDFLTLTDVVSGGKPEVVKLCRSARVGLAWYRGRQRDWNSLRGVPSRIGRKPHGCADARYLAALARERASIARRAYARWLERRTLRDFRVTPDSNAWLRAVQEAQRAYPNTSGWLHSCSSTEGGHGRWVPNSDGAPPGGWMQFYESTFWRMWSTAKVDVERRGFRVPRSAASWYSPLGQALAGAWGLTNGRRHEWNSSGC